MLCSISYFLSVAGLYTCQAFDSKCYWPQHFIVRCFVSWKPHSVPYLKIPYSRLAPDSSFSMYNCSLLLWNAWLHFSLLFSWPSHIGFGVCCSMSICILVLSVFLMVQILFFDCFLFLVLQLGPI